MLKKLKDILNTYTDEELKKMDLWIDCKSNINYIITDSDNIVLVTDGVELKIDGYIEQHGTRNYEDN